MPHLLREEHFVPRAQISFLCLSPSLQALAKAGVPVLARAECDGDYLYSHCLPGEIIVPFWKAAWPEKSLPVQGLTNHWAAQPGREDSWLYLAGEWEITAPRQCLLCLPPLLGCPACPFHPAVLLASFLGEQGSFFLCSVQWDVALQVVFRGW